MEFHEAAALFPLLEGERFLAFQADVATNGQRFPIVLWEGKVLDGRNRYRACMALGVTPHYTDLDGPPDFDADAFVVSANLHRRDLNESQRALIGAKLKARYEAKAREKQRRAAQETNRKRGQEAPKEPGGALAANLPQAQTRAPCARDQAAGAVNVSPRSIDHAATVVNKGKPELIQMVETGEVKVSAAATVAELPAPQQEEIVAAGPKAVKAKAKELREQSGSNGRTRSRRVGRAKRNPDSPQEVARNHPEVKWTQATHDLLMQFTSLRDLGGYETLAASWSRESRLAEAAELERMIVQLKTFIEILLRNTDG